MEGKRFRTAIHTEFEAGALRARGSIKNVGPGGLFVGTSSLPEQGEAVRLTFAAPGGAHIALSGLVWWTTAEGGRHAAPGFGLRLLDENEAYATMVESFD
jgi:Tfp pilus assembly protein PilZ